MESEIKKLLKEPFPTRYFSFIKAQFYLTSMEIEHNNFYDFAHKADSFLGEEDYTSSNIEVLARTFETFIFTKTDGKFDFISKNYNSDFYPQNEMRDKFNVFWEKTWKEFRSRLNNDFSKINTPLTVISNIQQFRRDNEEANNLKKKKLKSS